MDPVRNTHNWYVCVLRNKNRNWYIVTHDKDFKDLKATQKGRNLRIFYP